MPSVDDMTTAVVSSPAGTAVRCRTVASCASYVTDSAYVIVGFPLAIAGFVVLLVGLVARRRPVVTGIGLPVMAGALLRRPVLRRPRAAGDRPGAAAGPGPPDLPHRRAAAPACSGAVLITLVATASRGSTRCTRIVKFVLSIVAFVVTVDLVGGRARRHHLLGLRLGDPARRRRGRPQHLLGLGTAPAPRLLLYTAIGVFFLLSLPIVVRGAALLQASFGKVHADRRRRDAQQDHHAGGPAAGRRVGRGDRTAPAGARHPRRPAAAAGPAGHGPRPGCSSSSTTTPRRPAGRSTRRSPRPARRSTSCARCPGASHRRSWSTVACPARWPPSPAAG